MSEEELIPTEGKKVLDDHEIAKLKQDAAKFSHYDRIINQVKEDAKDLREEHKEEAEERRSFLGRLLRSELLAELTTEAGGLFDGRQTYRIADKSTTYSVGNHDILRAWIMENDPKLRIIEAIKLSMYEVGRLKESGVNLIDLGIVAKEGKELLIINGDQTRVRDIPGIDTPAITVPMSLSLVDPTEEANHDK